MNITDQVSRLPWCILLCSIHMAVDSMTEREESMKSHPSMEKAVIKEEMAELKQHPSLQGLYLQEGAAAHPSLILCICIQFVFI